MNNQIGLVDWGIGGLSVYKELKKEIKNFSCIYLSDAGHSPYGKTRSSKLIQRLHHLSDFFRKQDVKTIVIACNAASTVLGQLQKLNPDIKYYGMLEAGEKAIRQSHSKSVLVLAGKRTVQSQFFQKRFKDSKVLLLVRSAQPLSGLIEKGQQRSAIFIAEVTRLARNQQVKAVLLACTHYPAATAVFQKKFPNAMVIDPARNLAAELKKIIKPVSITSKSKFYTTGSVALSKASAYKAFQLKISSFEKVKIK